MIEDQENLSPEDVIQLFRISSLLLEMAEKDDDLMWACGALAAWIAKSTIRLGTEDVALLTKIGGILYTEGMIEFDENNNSDE